MSFATLQSLSLAAVSALEAGDYALAIQKATAALMYVGLTPDTESAGQAVYFRNAEQIQVFIAECKEARNAAARTTHMANGPFIQVPVAYTRTPSDGD